MVILLASSSNKPKPQFSSAHQVQSQDQSDSQNNSLPITQDQCQQLLALLKNHNSDNQASVHQVATTSANQDQLFSNMSGKFNIPSSVFNPIASVPNFSHSVFSATFIHSFQVASNHDLDPSPWIIDTGATDHMIGSVSFFTSITAIVSNHVKLPNGQLAAVTHIGTVKISEHLILTDVLCIPSFSFNLISASKLIKSLHCCLIFLDSFCFIQNMFPWLTIGLGKEKGGLFFLQNNSDFTSAFRSSFTAVSVKAPSTDVWHYRLGHPSQSRLDLLKPLLPNVPLHSNKTCTVCPSAKQRKLSFPVSVSCTKSPFDIIHCDIWGPFSVNTINGSRYFLTIVDDFTRFTWVYLMHHKSQTISSFNLSFLMLKHNSLQRSNA
jgi:hypothetical protein